MGAEPGGGAVTGATRALARRLARYAAGERLYEGPPAERILWGLAQTARAVRLVGGDRALLRAALLPTSLTFLGSAALAAVVARAEKGRFFEAAFAAFVAVSSMPPTLLWRQWVRVGLEARRAAGAPPGEEEHAGEPYHRVVARELWKAARQAAAVAVGIAPVALAVELVPFVGHGVTLALGALWTWYWVVLDALEIPTELVPGRLGEGEPTWFERALGAMGRRSRLLAPLRPAARFSGWLARPWRNEASFTERHRWESGGFALAAVAFLAVPVLGVFFRAVAITGATILVCELDPTPPSPEGSEGGTAEQG